MLLCVCFPSALDPRPSALDPRPSALTTLSYHPPMKATVIVELKPSVLDPQGKAIEHSLSSLGFAGVEDVRVGKLFRITLADGEQQSRAELESRLRQMCERLLANTVIENFSCTLEE
jgi:phosphoribosylformylglycinamidine synthase PurS subunit